MKQRTDSISIGASTLHKVCIGVKPALHTTPIPVKESIFRTLRSGLDYLLAAK